MHSLRIQSGQTIAVSLSSSGLLTPYRFIVSRKKLILPMRVPPRAIQEQKQLVRGERKWYVDFDKCIPYFVKTLGCAICIEVCPWSEPGRGPDLSRLLLQKRRADAAKPLEFPWDGAAPGVLPSP